MSYAEHLIENAICAMEHHPYPDAMKEFFEWEVNIDMAKRCGVPLDAVWEMAQYCVTTYRQSVMEDYRTGW